MFCASAPPPEGSNSKLVIPPASTAPRAEWADPRDNASSWFTFGQGFRASPGLLHLAREISLHRREVKALPAAVFISCLAVGNAHVREGEPRAGAGRLEIDDDPRIRIIEAELARPPGLHNALAGNEPQNLALDV